MLHRIISLLFALIAAAAIHAALVDVVPSAGFPAGEPNCVGDRPGAINPNIMIPCRCPPTPEAIANQVQARIGGDPQAFPLGLDLESRIRRYEITISAIQDLRCPAASTTIRPRLSTLTSLRGLPENVVSGLLAGLPLNDVPSRPAPMRGACPN